MARTTSSRTLKLAQARATSREGWGATQEEILIQLELERPGSLPCPHFGHRGARQGQPDMEAA